MRALIPLLAAAVMMSCGSSRTATQPEANQGGSAAPSGPTAATEAVPIEEPVKAPERIVGGDPSYIPRALIYRTNGDYADNVPITVNAAGDQVVSYPAPTDLRNATPVPLADGWLLDRRGVNLNTRFTTYTYKEYSEMQAAPSIERLLHSVIPGARVTEVKRLDMTTQEALADTAAINLLILQK
ncbi:MAG: hypothetical protein LIP02_14930 [Bacteroidales bacterium]|nr:hypothetical protein [Bacteroidales bacterium]